MPLVVAKRLTIRGFVVMDKDLGPKYTKDHQKNLQKCITEGVDNAAEGLVGMLTGKNFGKAVLKVADL
jgi:NADPH-dependent curcumin reductase CurA